MVKHRIKQHSSVRLVWVFEAIPYLLFAEVCWWVFVGYLGASIRSLWRGFAEIPIEY